MCVGVPMKIVEINYPMAIAEAKGVKRNISLMLLPEDRVKVGDYVMVHVGNAIEVIDEKEAKEIWEALDEVMTALNEEEG
ncbi:hydrogenase assembly chaperone hypC/hupF [Desulfurobacterium thermolithotrophum DSM 11699]|uniref:Hydrogenase assembly chaperone hypC/hupF n=1 Tax=Desulfurobacterium thermolithotrophum (strain DSM 11699 / BSA) TaxID=868864 RepID=F0S2N9_DESTD|nr:HypC/HybG/HupF family hydrogenase formation chaperone [Desulfurobacterium thermolithotrophum]ADY73111.1 hydrogenase assembly chaperone hypC/hupF [Desulfurobacterium thermolithotrophum DSM 11699]